MSAAGIWVPGAMKIEAAIDFSLSALCGIRDTASRDRLASDTTAEHKFAGANWVGVFQIGEVGKSGGGGSNAGILLHRNRLRNVKSWLDGRLQEKPAITLNSPTLFILLVMRWAQPQPVTFFGKTGTEPSPKFTRIAAHAIKHGAKRAEFLPAGVMCAVRVG